MTVATFVACGKIIKQTKHLGEVAGLIEIVLTKVYNEYETITQLFKCVLVVTCTAGYRRRCHNTFLHDGTSVSNTTNKS